ncbi:hypothetical protein SAMN02745673_01490 [Marinactinospora thermotolerans DSM 45154]|uniref:Uncharacterized protein n=1 Tax=Marinactinospora thermotolerans DSM 45154 TaxID=1122192 RepID=A0A1T4NL15_9ACTN|nr:hypothetical protein [Marinactinospora thermotolerans]SJZ79853.1 hypothetical protein SAMN02745673_01490 [Marinactinospora thermotolerans DSM 45154]
MNEFIIGVLSSIIATALTVTLGWLFSRGIRRRIVARLAGLTGLGIHYVYDQQREAERDLALDLNNARWLWVMAGRGNALTRDTFVSLWTKSAGRLESTRILLPDPEGGPESWLTKREEEIQKIDPGFRPGLLAEQVNANLTYLSEIARKTKNTAIRFYDLPNMCRVIATDEAAYITFYRPSEHGRNSPCVYTQRPSLMYDFALHLFSRAWEASRPLDDGAPYGPHEASVHPSPPPSQEDRSL